MRFDAAKFLLQLADTTRSIFVCYHHWGNGFYYNALASSFSAYKFVRDNSVQRIIDSDDSAYVMRKIRKDYLTGTSCSSPNASLPVGSVARPSGHAAWPAGATAVPSGSRSDVGEDPC